MEPRKVATYRDEKYMGLAWIHAGFSKDPSTQVGAQVISHDNNPLGSGYNGPPRRISDDSFDWSRPKRGQTGTNKYHLVRHAEINAMDHSVGDLKNSTLYVTALPCPACMLEIVAKEVSRVVYYDYQSTKDSSLQNSSWRELSFDIAARGNLMLEKFEGNIDWVFEWTERLKELNLMSDKTK